MDEGLLARQRTESLGEITGGVVHDFNNTLTAIVGYSDLATQVAEEGSPQHRYALAVSKAAIQSMRFIEQIRVFLSPGVGKPEAVSVHGILDDVTELLSSVLPGNIVVEKEYEAQDDTVYGAPALLYQVLLNLAVNARDAMPQGGTLRIATANGEATPIPSDPAKAPDRSIRVLVTDTGTGIAPENEGRLFLQGFSTKSHGSGLGLWVVKHNVDAFGGHIFLETKPGKGTTFGLELPLSKKSPDTDSTRGDVLLGSGSILLVDDDETVLDAVGEMLKSLGYGVRPFSTSRTALAFYEKDHGHVDAVLLDMNMPDMDGFALFDALAEIDPAVKGYLFTAEDATNIDRIDRNEAILGVLQKPLKLAQISQAMSWIFR